MAACTLEIYWYYYIIVAVVTYFGGLLILIPARICWYALHKKRNTSIPRQDRKREFNCFSRMRAQASNILSGHTNFSKAVLQLLGSNKYNRDICGQVIGDTTQYIWLAFSCFFVAHYIIRFTAAPDKVYMWADLYSIVDHFTIGPLFVGLYLNRNWLDILQLSHIIKARNSIRIAQVVSIFATIWLTSSGFVHIVENNGDPFSNYSNGQRLTYWECVYWLLVTMSTVGFGEISPSTDIGRAFIVIFIMGSFAMFSTIIPELARAFGRNTKYHKPYKMTYGKKNKPGLEMEAFFKRHLNDVKFVQGTVMDLKTLEGVKVSCSSGNGHGDSGIVSYDGSVVVVVVVSGGGGGGNDGTGKGGSGSGSVGCDSDGSGGDSGNGGGNGSGDGNSGGSGGDRDDGSGNSGGSGGDGSGNGGGNGSGDGNSGGSGGSGGDGGDGSGNSGGSGGDGSGGGDNGSGKDGCSSGDSGNSDSGGGSGGGGCSCKCGGGGDNSSGIGGRGCSGIGGRGCSGIGGRCCSGMGGRGCSGMGGRGCSGIGGRGCSGMGGRGCSGIGGRGCSGMGGRGCSGMGGRGCSGMGGRGCSGIGGRGCSGMGGRGCSGMGGRGCSGMGGIGGSGMGGRGCSGIGGRGCSGMGGRGCSGIGGRGCSGIGGRGCSGIGGSIYLCTKIRDYLHYADACLIIANRSAVNPDAEDAANVMRATAVKNFNPDIRIIIQLLQYRNKLNLLHIPNWRWQSAGDDVICIAELKNGILAQNCLAPGASTLLCNLFTSRSSKRTNSSNWIDLYKEGAGNEIYIEDLSEAFVGMTFTQTASICMTELHMILVAVYVPEKNGKMKLKVNPGRGLIITSKMAGFFIAQSPEVAKRARTYRGDICDHRQPRFCPPSLGVNGKASNEYLNEASEKPCLPSISSDDDNYLEYLETIGSRLAHHGDSDPALLLHMNPADTGNREMLDITGMFHWCPSRSLEECLLDKAEARDHMFKGHVIVCLNASKDSPESGLVNFVLPLRSSCLRMNELRDIVFLTDPEHIEKEWKELANFPNIYVLPWCVVVVFGAGGVIVLIVVGGVIVLIVVGGAGGVIGGAGGVIGGAGGVIVFIVCFFIVWCVVVVFGAGGVIVLIVVGGVIVLIVVGGAGGVIGGAGGVIGGAGGVIGGAGGVHIDVDETLIDNEAILTTLTIKSMFGVDLERRIQSFGVLTNPEVFRRDAGMADDVPTITELEYDYNVVYVDPDDDDDPMLSLHLTAPFACSKAFVTSVLDSLLSCTYLNRAVLTLARALITGGETTEFEKVLSEGLNIVRKNTLIDVSSARPKSRLAQLSLACGPLEKLTHNFVYGELFNQSLYTYDILCLGLYRLMHPNSKDPRDRKRVVLCNCNYDLKLYPSDRVFVLQPYDMKYNPAGSQDTSCTNTPDALKSSVFFSPDSTQGKEQISQL
ncbi:hypothetical protein LSH36_639g01022 [Paralvinella palmiformis]|uniref:BK channel n=1 Tax=Paralvinella palmiformis TaxID=53620 RepID=A0AAD9J4Q6_9ANNE|nr:hypothetical protein LSH36_639g01022 [Paralvinella palmiformis]